MKGMFNNGLKEVIQVELKLHPVQELSDMMDYTQKIDEKNVLMNKSSAGISSTGKPIRTYNNSQTITWEFGNKNHVHLPMGLQVQWERQVVPKLLGPLEEKVSED